MIACGVLSQIAHLFILQTFPFVVIMSPAFLSAVVFIIVNHYLAFQYFNSVYHSFSEVIMIIILFCNLYNYFKGLVIIKAVNALKSEVTELIKMLSDDLEYWFQVDDFHEAAIC